MSITGQEAIIKNLIHKCDTQTQQLAHLHDLLAPAPELLERAVKYADHWHLAQGKRDAAALRELAQALRAAMEEEEEG